MNDNLKEIYEEEKEFLIAELDYSFKQLMDIKTIIRDDMKIVVYSSLCKDEILKLITMGIYDFISNVSNFKLINLDEDAEILIDKYIDYFDIIDVNYGMFNEIFV